MYFSFLSLTDCSRLVQIKNVEKEVFLSNIFIGLHALKKVIIKTKSAMNFIVRQIFFRNFIFS